MFTHKTGLSIAVDDAAIADAPGRQTRERNTLSPDFILARRITAQARSTLRVARVIRHYDSALVP
jgi:hypothetical protein